MATVPTTPGSTTPGFFQQPNLAPAPNLEPPGFDLLRSLLMQKIFAEEASPYGQTGDTSGLFTGQGRGMFNPYSGGYGQGPSASPPMPPQGMPPGGSGGQQMGGGPGIGMPGYAPPPPQQGGGYGFDGYTLNNQISRNGDFDGCRMGYDGPTWTGGPAPESPNMSGGPTMGGAANQTPAPGGSSWTTGAGMNSGPTMGGAANRTPAPGGPTWTAGAGLESPNMSGGPTNNPLLASLAQQNMENSGQGPKAWNSTAANNPWAGMNQQQFQQSMANNIGGGGIFGIERQLGPNWQATAQNSPQMNLPGFAYTGAQHEFGGNPFIGAAAARAGWSPQQTALWTAQGYLRNQQQNPGSGQNFYWHGGPGTDGRRIGYDMPMPGAPPVPMAGPQPGGMMPHRPPMGGVNPQHAAALHAIMAALMAKKRGMAHRPPMMGGAPPQGMPAPPMAGPRPMGMDSPYMFQNGPRAPLGMDGNPFMGKQQKEAKFVVAGRGGRPHRMFDEPRTI